ncbi:unnamed protein product [Prorocentrum cordatum]|uniref:Uncharacterized protein n=1 Tax=Prorocentrum cordatum TaxID=2364126 RepID=A0ABN9SNA1_9DINO|nr:unnamed protein product [Polarella glacialis]
MVPPPLRRGASPPLLAALCCAGLAALLLRPGAERAPPRAEPAAHGARAARRPLPGVHLETAAAPASECAAAVAGAEERSSGWRRSEECKCPKHTFLTGHDVTCTDLLDTSDITRRYYFTASRYAGKGCSCVRLPRAEEELFAALEKQAHSNVLYEALFKHTLEYLSALEGDGGSTFGADLTRGGKKPITAGDLPWTEAGRMAVYNPYNFCPLKSHSERKAAAEKVGGTIFKIVQAFNEFNIWIWSDGEDRSINPATDDDLFRNGPVFLPFTPTWDEVRAGGLMFALLPTLILTDGGNRTTWFNNAAWKTCWEPNPLASGPMIFKYPQVQASLHDPGQRRGYYTATAPQHPDFFHPEGPLFIDGDRHRSFRRLLELAGFARRYPVDAGLVRAIPAPGGEAPSEADVAAAVGPLVMKGIWGAEPTPEAREAMGTYARFGKYAIFGKEIHRFALGPTGIADTIKEASGGVTAWATTTPFRDLLRKAVEVHGPANPWFLKEDRVLDDLTLATLFAGLVGTTDMTMKCILYQQRDQAHVTMFKEDPEKYLIELMRYDSAVTSVTELLRKDQAMNLEGRNITLKQGSPVQLVLASANRDPTHWMRADDFDPSRPDLKDTLSWNGRVEDVEARSLERAPRHCPGHCLSLKVAAAVCAKMMGSFDELEREGKVLHRNGEVKCNNFNEADEPPLWNPPADLAVPKPYVPDLSQGEVLIKEHVECDSRDLYIASFKTVSECARAVKSAGGKARSWISYTAGASSRVAGAIWSTHRRRTAARASMKIGTTSTTFQRCPWKSHCGSTPISCSGLSRTRVRGPNPSLARSAVPSSRVRHWWLGSGSARKTRIGSSPKSRPARTSTSSLPGRAECMWTLTKAAATRKQATAPQQSLPSTTPRSSRRANQLGRSAKNQRTPGSRSRASLESPRRLASLAWR